MPITTTAPHGLRRSHASSTTTARRLARALRGFTRRLLAAYAESAWVYRYGPGFAPTAPVRFADTPADPAYRTQRLGTPAPNAPPRQAPLRQAPASRSAAQASASA